jgi:nucleotide-binding universal stress UspA family protein
MAKNEIRRILCPTDFSEPSRRALEYALAVAAWDGAALTALYVMADTTVPASELAYMANPMLLDHALQESTLSDLSAIVAPARKLGLHAEAVVRDGKPAAEIVRMAGELPADLVVMGTHGRTGVQRLMLGSVAETVLRRVHCPVLTVPAHAPEHPGPLFFKRILCATDFSPASAAAVCYAASLAEEADACLTLLHVFDPEKLRDLEDCQAGHDRRRDFERTARLMLRGTLPKSTLGAFSTKEIVTLGTAATEILHVAGQVKADLIVLGVHGRSLLDLMAFGSVTHQVVREAACPVLTVRPPSGRIE